MGKHKETEKASMKGDDTVETGSFRSHRSDMRCSAEVALAQSIAGLDIGYVPAGPDAFFRVGPVRATTIARRASSFFSFFFSCFFFFFLGLPFIFEKCYEGGS